MDLIIPDCSVKKYLSIGPAGPEAYQALAGFHYRDSTSGPFSHLFAIHEGHSRRRIMAPVVGVIVYRPPAANLAIRTIATGGFFSGLPRAAGLALLNEHVRCISRVIIDPRYRGLGLAGRLVRETMPQTGAAMVEAASVMGLFHPFFTRAGMVEFRRPPDVKTERMKAALETVGIERRLWIDTEQVHRQIDALNTPSRQFIEQQMQDFLQKFARRRNSPHSPGRTDFVLSKLGHPGNYYLWLNPEKPVPGLAIA
jgi:hypothetical protein